MAVDHAQARDEGSGEGGGGGVAVGAKGEFGLEGAGKGVGGGVGARGRVGSRRGRAQRAPRVAGQAVGGGVRVAGGRRGEAWGAGSGVVLEVDAGVVPWVAVAGVAGFHGDEGSLGGVGRRVLEERAGGVGSVAAAVKEGAEAAHAARLAKLIEEGPLLAVLSESRAGWRLRGERSFSALKQLRLEERHVVLKGVRLGARDSTLHLSRFQTAGDEGKQKEVNGIFEATGIVASVAEHQLLDNDLLVTLQFRPRLTQGNVDFVLVSELLSSVEKELLRPDKGAELLGGLELQLMSFRYHALMDLLVLSKVGSLRK